MEAHCYSTFTNLVEKWVILEKTLIAKGEVKIYTKAQNSQGTSNDKNKLWSYNKNVTNDGIVDVKSIYRMGPTLTLKTPNTSDNTTYVPNQVANAIQNNQEYRPSRQLRKYT